MRLPSCNPKRELRRPGTPLAFSGVGVVRSGEEQIPMNLRLAVVGLGLAILLGGSALLPQKSWAQEAASEAGKRKVKTKVAPEYPTLAKQMNVTGKVKIEATIAADGHVATTKVVGGSPLLVNGALE